MTHRPIWSALTAVIALQPLHVTANPLVPTVRVECEFANGRAFPFSAGQDRCWHELNGRMLAPKAVIACAHAWADGRLSVTFRISELLKPECDTDEAQDRIATEEQVRIALPVLSAKEHDFVSKHSVSR